MFKPPQHWQRLRSQVMTPGSSRRSGNGWGDGTLRRGSHFTHRPGFTFVKFFFFFNYTFWKQVIIWVFNDHFSQARKILIVFFLFSESLFRARNYTYHKFFMQYCISFLFGSSSVDQKEQESKPKKGSFQNTSFFFFFNLL